MQSVHSYTHALDNIVRTVLGRERKPQIKAMNFIQEEFHIKNTKTTKI